MAYYNGSPVQGLIEAEEKLAAMDHRPDLRRDLQQQKVNATKNIERVDRLLELLDKNPDIEEILKLLGRY